jgi:membrane dipeptidase
MKFIDLHCDCINKLYYSNDNENILKNGFHVDIEKLKKGECFVQTFAIFLDEDYVKTQNQNLFDEFKKMLICYHKQVNMAKEYIAHIDQKEKKQNKDMYALLSCEGCAFVENDLTRLEYINDEGIKMASLTWNYENCLAYPNSQSSTIMQNGLKKFGFKTVEFFNEKKIIIDVSHLSDGGIKDILAMSKMPVIASHSNARAIAYHPRNLTDEFIKKIADSGGVIGINFYPPFLTTNDDAKIDDIIHHIKYIINKGGEDVVSLGSDFDGIEITPKIDDSSQMQLLYHNLKKESFVEPLIEKIFYKNALRLLSEYKIF